MDQLIVSGARDALERWGKSGPSGPCTIIGEVHGAQLEIAGRLTVQVSELRRSFTDGLIPFF